MRIFRFVLLTILILLNLVAGCQSPTISISISDSNYADERGGEYGVLKLADAIKDSDFCIIGNIRVKSKEVLKEISIVDNTNKLIRKEPCKWKMTGEVEVTSIVWGNPGTNTVSFSTIQTTTAGMDSYRGENSWRVFFDDCWSFLFPEEGDTFIIIGKGQGKDAVVTHPIRPKTVEVVYEEDTTGKTISIIKPISNDLQLRVESIRTIRNIETKPEPEQKEERQKLLAESNNTELLVYVYYRSFNDGGVDRDVDIVKTLFTVNTTPKRKFLSYWFANNLLDGNMITPQQREILKEIVIKGLMEINTIDEGATYLRELNPKTLEATLKERIRPITVELSKRFGKEKDYYKLDRWIKEIFPPEEKTGK